MKATSDVAPDLAPALTVALAPGAEDLRRAVAAIARRHDQASGLLMKLVLRMGGRAENLLEHLPDSVRENLERTTLAALERVYDAADRMSDVRGLPQMGPWGAKAGVTFSGAAGGFWGMPSTVVEIPVTVAMMFGAIQKVAVEHGFDPRDSAVRLECIKVFGAGGPLMDDDGVDTSFLSSKLAINGPMLHAVLRAVAPRFAALMGQKLATQTLPVLGAVAGAGVNYAFISYYQDMAHVRFGLRKLASSHDPVAVRAAFLEATTQKRVTR